VPSDTQHTKFFNLPEDFTFASGAKLDGLVLAYQTWGTLNKDRSNAILLNHALSGTPHAQGINTQGSKTNDLWAQELHQGWWEDFMGPGKAIDTDKFFVISANYLGGCYDWSICWRSYHPYLCNPPP